MIFHPRAVLALILAPIAAFARLVDAAMDFSDQASEDQW